MAKMKIIFDGFSDLAEAIDRAGGDLKEAVDEALTETQSIVQESTTSASMIYSHKGGGKKGYATGAMFSSILTSAQITWKGSVAEVGVGFDLTTNGGYHSIFVMYGTPKMAKDAKVYNAIKGTKVRKQIAEKQEEIMEKHLDLAKGV